MRKAKPQNKQILIPQNNDESIISVFVCIYLSACTKYLQCQLVIVISNLGQLKSNITQYPWKKGSLKNHTPLQGGDDEI